MTDREIVDELERLLRLRNGPFEPPPPPGGGGVPARAGWFDVAHAETYQFLVNRAHFPPKDYLPNGNIASWYTHVVRLALPEVEAGDWGEYMAVVAVPGYGFLSNAFVPLFAYINPRGSQVPYENQAQKAGYSFPGLIIKPASGENTSNMGGNYTRPHQVIVRPFRHLFTQRGEYVLDLVLALSSFGAGNGQSLGVESAGGQSALFATHKCPAKMTPQILRAVEEASRAVPVDPDRVVQEWWSKNPECEYDLTLPTKRRKRRGRSKD